MFLILLAWLGCSRDSSDGQIEVTPTSHTQVAQASDDAGDDSEGEGEVEASKRPGDAAKTNADVKSKKKDKEFSSLKLLFGLVGGLGIFLLGMKNLSEGMQAVAGQGLRQMINYATTNRYLATVVGVIVTMGVQSSSITTVMVVGFVNSGLMELAQGIGVIMGANIGTTITGWILILKIGKYGLPILGVAAFVYLFSKGDRWRYWAMVIMGLGMVFFGLEIMKEACSIIKELPAFEEWFKKFDASSYPGILMCALAGCVLTMMVQSSSATLGITITLAATGSIPFETAAALVLGENIGTTITALLASLGATTNAKRAAYFHAIFNLIGVFWVTLLFKWYLGVVVWAAGAVHAGLGLAGDPGVGMKIATTHTIFNIVNTLAFMPFVPFFVRFLQRVVPSKDFKEKPHLTDLDVRMLETPALAIEQSHKEIEKMGDGCTKMLVWLNELVQQDDPDTTLADRLMHREQVLDSVQDEVAEYITNLLSRSVPHSLAEEGRRQMRMADEYESVSDYIANLDRFDRKLRQAGHRFTAGQIQDLAHLNKQCEEYLTAINAALVSKNTNILVSSAPMATRIYSEIKQLRRKHLDELSGGEMVPQVSIAYLATLNAYSRVRDHSTNIAEAISGEK